MRKSIPGAALFAACLGAASAFAAAAGPQAAPPQQATAAPRTIGETIEATVQVVAVDHASRQVTLKDEDGDVQTITVGPQVQRFDQVAVGDVVRVRYSIGITSELRAATEAEKAEPFVAMEGSGRSPDGAAPAGGAMRTFRIVATVDAIDKDAGTATLEGPNGNAVTVQVQDPALLDAAKVGDTVVVTATESIALSLEKVDPPPATK